MLSNPSSTRLWLVTGTSLFAASTLAIACGGQVGPADGDEDTTDATGGSFANVSTGTSKSGGVTPPKGGGGMGSSPAMATGSRSSNAQGATTAVLPGIPGISQGGRPGATSTVVFVQGGWSSQGPGKRTTTGDHSTSGPTPAQGGSVATSTAAGPTCRNGVRDGDACNPTYDLTECVVRTTRICTCDSKKSAWECRANDENTGGTSSTGGRSTAVGGKSDFGTGGKHGGSDPVAGQSSVNLAGAGGA